MSWFLTLPLMTPFATGVLAYLLRERPSGRWISVTGSLLAVLFSVALFVQVQQNGVIAGQMGNWAAPFGITLAADLLSALLVLLTALTGLAVSVFAMGEINTRLEQLGFYTMFQILLGGVTGAFLTGDIFNLYVWFEVMLIASFGLIILGGRPEQIDGAVKYVTLNLIATILFLSGIGLLYGLTGTLNMADLSQTVAASEKKGLLSIVALFFIIAFCMKAAVFPLFAWLPASYHTPTFAVSAIFAALLTKVGVYSLLRVFTLIFDLEGTFLQTLLLWAAGLTMLTGVIGAISQTNLRRILSFQIIASIGSLILGLALYSPLAIAGAIFYLAHNIVVKATLFMCAGVSTRLTGSEDLRGMGGLYRTAPLFSALVFIAIFALAGFPPLTGFWAKFLLVKASLDLQAWVLAGVTLLTGLLTIWSMATVWNEGFLKPHPDGREPSIADLKQDALPLLLPIAAMIALLIAVGLMPQPLITLAERAAAQLLASDAYIAAVLGAQS